MRDGLRFRAAGWGGSRVLGAVFRTASFEVVAGGEHFARIRARGEPCIMVVWHGRLLPAVYHHRHQGIAALVSRSADGEYIARVLRRWGYETVRGSSSRGGASAFREMVRLARAGRSIAFTPDGPRGPRQKLKPGALAAAQATGLPVLPVAAGADRGWWIEGWDRFLVPKPFARIRVAYGEPEIVPREADAAEIAALERRLEGELNRLLEVVDGDGGR
ncbi:MAG TPA: lysophospholipid acyltransferase family protein [Longimicrobiales bacterium]